MHLAAVQEMLKGIRQEVIQELLLFQVEGM